MVVFTRGTANGNIIIMRNKITTHAAAWCICIIFSLCLSRVISGNDKYIANGLSIRWKSRPRPWYTNWWISTWNRFATYCNASRSCCTTTRGNWTWRWTFFILLFGTTKDKQDQNKGYQAKFLRSHIFLLKKLFLKFS